MNTLNSELQKLALSSVSLRRINDQLIPTGIASGCLVDYRDTRILLTAAHGVRDGGRWGVEVRWVPGKGTQIYGLGEMNFLFALTPATGDVKEIDFAYATFPKDVHPLYQEIEPPGKVVRECPLSIHQLTNGKGPSTESSYGFCGNILPQIEQHPGLTFLGCERPIYTGLRYDRSVGEFDVFKLPMNHPGHQYFKGCSGAPVLDEAGDVTSLVCHGDQASDEIWTVGIRRFRSALDILIQAR